MYHHQIDPKKKLKSVLPSTATAKSNSFRKILNQVAEKQKKKTIATVTSTTGSIHQSNSTHQSSSSILGGKLFH